MKNSKGGGGLYNYKTYGKCKELPPFVLVLFVLSGPPVRGLGMDVAQLAERLDTTHEVSVLLQSPTLKQVVAHTGNLSTRLYKPLAIFKKKSDTG